MSWADPPNFKLGTTDDRTQMTADELQNWARLLRWVGLAVTAIGLVLTFASHVVADRLLVVQRNDKIEAQERLKQTEAELRDAKTKAAKALETATELDKRQAPRTIPTAAGLEMVANLKIFSGQKYTAVIASTGGDVQPLWSSIDQLLTQAGWTRVEPAGLAVGNPPAGVLIAPSPGIILAIDESSRDSIGPAVEYLSKSLNLININTGLTFGRDPKETRLDVLTLIIGPKS